MKLNKILPLHFASGRDINSTDCPRMNQALSGSPSSFRLFFEWFREREDLENEYRRDKSRYRDSQLQGGADRYRTFSSGIQEPSRAAFAAPDGSGQGRRGTGRQSALGRGEMHSRDGRRLARRMAIANPKMPDPLQGDAIALIDEADLHLHPSWQRRLASAFAETFPNCQFLLTTHSPAILSHLQPRNIWILERFGKVIEAARPASSYGQKVDRILEDVMDVSAQPDEIRDKVSLLFLAIEQRELKKARRILDELTDEIGTDPDLVKADLLIRRRETLGR